MHEFRRRISRAALLLVAVAALAACNANGAGTDSAVTALTGANGGDAAVPGVSEGNIRVVSDLPPPPQAEGGEQRVAENDILEIDVFQVDDLDRTAQVDPRGMIALPLIGEVRAAGKTVRQLEDEIRRRYGERYLQSPQVSVFVKESFGQRVTVDGEVRKAGIYPTTSTTTLIDVLAQAGGLSDIADASKVYVFRDMGNGEKLVANYDARAIRRGKRGNPRIYGGDVVVVFASGARVAMRNLRDAMGIARNAAFVVP